MGYYSVVRESSEPVKVTFLIVEESAEDRAFREEAERRGYSAPISSTSDGVDELNALLKTHELDYFLTFEPHEGYFELKTTGESGKAYDFETDLSGFVSKVSRLGAEITGILFLEGEDVGDVKRFLFDGNRVIVDKARLVFSDGTEYPG